MAVKKKTPKRKSVTKKPATKKVAKKVTRKSNSKKPKSKSSGKKAFGGYAISFAGRKETVEDVFGKKPIAPSEMTKKIWAFVKSKSLSNR